MINGIDGDNGGQHSSGTELRETFGDETAVHFRCFGGIKRSERENVQLRAWRSCHRRWGEFVGLSYRHRSATFVHLRRTGENQFGEPVDGHKTRILQIAIGELHVKLLLDLGDEFDDLH